MSQERKKTMGIGSVLGHLIKGKVLAVTAAGAILVGGTTAALAATSPGQDIIHTITGAHGTTPTGQSHDDATAKKKDTPASVNADNHKGECPGLAEAQKLATTFSLSTASTSDDVQAICSLHEGTFRGKTANGSSVSSDRVFGYGEIDQLLTYAQSLAAHDQTNAGGKLTDKNVRTYLAEALQSCGTTPLAVCLKNHLPASRNSGKNDNHGNSDTNANGGNTPDKNSSGGGSTSNAPGKSNGGSDNG